MAPRLRPNAEGQWAQGAIPQTSRAYRFTLSATSGTPAPAAWRPRRLGPDRSCSSAAALEGRWPLLDIGLDLGRRLVDWPGGWPPRRRWRPVFSLAGLVTLAPTHGSRCRCRASPQKSSLPWPVDARRGRRTVVVAALRRRVVVAPAAGEGAEGGQDEDDSDRAAHQCSQMVRAGRRRPRRRPGARVFQDSVAHLIRTGNLTTPRRASSSPTPPPGRAPPPPRPLPSPSRRCSWIDIMALKARMRSRASATVRPLTAAVIIDADDWLIEQPWPSILMSATCAVVVDVDVQDDLVAAQRVEALDPLCGRRWAARHGSAGCGSGRG